jgi:DNA mismatch repair protein MSH2
MNLKILGMVPVCHCFVMYQTEPCSVDQKQMEAEIPAEVTEEGIEIMEEFLRTWSSRGPVKDGEDIVMTSDDAQDSESRVGELRSCLEKFRPRIEKNLWLQSVLTSF